MTHYSEKPHRTVRINAGVYINPLTYGVDLLRNIVFGISTFSVALDYCILFVSGFGIIFLAVLLFNRGEY
jgi:ABC-type polysaccharide/polyol phosphate export permease